MGIDCYLEWNTKSELDHTPMYSFAPERGYIRESYNLLYHFTPYLFKEAWQYPPSLFRTECYITSAEFRRRVAHVIEDLKEGRLEKYILKDNPIKDELNLGILPKRMMKVSCGPNGEPQYNPTTENVEDPKDIEEIAKHTIVIPCLKDAKENYLNWKDYETCYNEFANLFEELENQGEDPYVEVSY